MFWEHYSSYWSSPLGMGWFHPLGSILLGLLALWTFIWKGMALWETARNGKKVWFVVFLLVNTLGILEILYLHVFSKKDHHHHRHHA